MTTDNPRPAPTDARAGVLTAEQIEQIDERLGTFRAGACMYDGPERHRAYNEARIALTHTDIPALVASHRALTAQLRAAEERERTLTEVDATRMRLRPEVRAFAEAMQCLLDQNQGEKGDGWKSDNPHDLLVTVYRKTDRLSNVVDLALSSGNLKESVLVAAASVAAHAMFVADVMEALAASSQRAGDEALASPEVAASAAPPAGEATGQPEG